MNICITMFVAMDKVYAPDPIGAKLPPVPHRIIDVDHTVRRWALALPEHEA